MEPVSPRAPSSPRHVRIPARLETRRLGGRAQAEPTLVEQALRSPDDRVRQWGLAEIVRLSPKDGGKDASRCSRLARFIRASRSCDHHALLDALDLHGISPRMLPVVKELMQSKSADVRLRAAPLWGALIGLYSVSGGQ
jgi:hypothetical protein